MPGGAACPTVPRGGATGRARRPPLTGAAGGAGAGGAAALAATRRVLAAAAVSGVALRTAGAAARGGGAAGRAVRRRLVVFHGAHLAGTRGNTHAGTRGGLGNDEAPHDGGASLRVSAATYSPTQLPRQYHRRWRA